MPYDAVSELPDAVKELPKLGEIRRGLELGRPSKSLRYIWHACEDCGKERWVQFYNGKPCSRRCRQCGYLSEGAVKRGKANPFWKGGRFRDSQGYILVNIQPDDFFYPMASHNVVYEHRLVVAKALYRCLLPWEIVHHKNAIKDDNRYPENLQLLPSRSPHMVDTQMKRYVNKLENRILYLEGRITQLEAEVILVREGDKYALHSR